MKTLLLLGLVTLTGFSAVERRSLDLRLPSQAQMERQIIASPGATTTTTVLSSVAGPTSAAATSVSSFSGQPDVPRALVVTRGGTTAVGMPACAVTVSGTNINGASISETLSLVGAQAAIEGFKAFKTVTSVAWAAGCETGNFSATWSVGRTNRLGLKKCMRNAGHFFQATYADAFQSTRPTVVASASTVEGNTVWLSTALGGQDVEAFFVQNFACSP